MPLIITPGLGGILQFQNLTPLAPALIGENIPRFWDLPNPAQVETLASAYHHLSRNLESNGDLLDKLGDMIRRFEARENPIATDSFILSRLVSECAKMRDTSLSDRPDASSGSAFVAERPKTPPPESPGGSTRRPTPRRRDQSLRLYRNEGGGFFPTQWAYLSEDMRGALKAAALARAGRVNDLTGDEELHAELLVGVLAGWIVSIKDMLTDLSAKGAGGQSGLASSAIRSPLRLITEMISLMVDGTRFESSLISHFWRFYGSHSDLRMAINRLTGMRSLQSLLKEGERTALDTVLFNLDRVYLRVLLEPLVKRDGTSVPELGSKDEAYGELLAKNLGDILVALPLSNRTALTADGEVQMLSAVSILRSLMRELPADPPSPAVRGFLKKILPSEMLRIAQFAALIPS